MSCQEVLYLCRVRYLGLARRPNPHSHRVLTHGSAGLATSLPTRGLLAASKTLETSPRREDYSARRTCRATAERRINAIYIYTLPEQKMTSFASALVSCIGVIAAGYGAGRMKVIDPAGALSLIHI